MDSVYERTELFSSLLICVLFYIIFLSRRYYQMLHRQFEPPSSLDLTLSGDILAVMGHLITTDLKLAVLIICYPRWFGM